MISKTTSYKKHWHHTRDLHCPTCKVIENETNNYLCTECFTVFKDKP